MLIMTLTTYLAWMKIRKYSIIQLQHYLEYRREPVLLVRFSFFEWTAEHQKIFEQLKSILLESILLTYPDFSLPSEVATDASSYGIGGVLYQIKGKTIHYISFVARALRGGEVNYGATKRQLLAIVFSLENSAVTFGDQSSDYTPIIRL